jgi:hypothetical protein
MCSLLITSFNKASSRFFVSCSKVTPGVTIGNEKEAAIQAVFGIFTVRKNY